jgi:hypothetical protein
LIFLVGDAPPKHYAEEMAYPQIAESARRRGILINPVQCGTDSETGTVWKAIASASRGETAQLLDASEVQRIHTPVDQDLVALNKRLGATFLPYRDAEATAETQAMAERMDASGVSDRLAFKVASGGLVPEDDLLRAIDAGSITLSAIDRSRLPERFRSMTEAELLAHVETVREERRELGRVIASLVNQRREMIDARTGKAGGFDRVVADTIRRQLAATGRL